MVMLPGVFADKPSTNRRLEMSQMLFHEVARDWWERYMLSGNRDYAEESWRWSAR